MKKMIFSLNICFETIFHVIQFNGEKLVDAILDKSKNIFFKANTAWSTKSNVQ